MPPEARCKVFSREGVIFSCYGLAGLDSEKKDLFVSSAAFECYS